MLVFPPVEFVLLVGSLATLLVLIVLLVVLGPPSVGFGSVALLSLVRKLTLSVAIPQKNGSIPLYSSMLDVLHFALDTVCCSSILVVVLSDALLSLFEGSILGAYKFSPRRLLRLLAVFRISVSEVSELPTFGIFVRDVSAFAALVACVNILIFYIPSCAQIMTIVWQSSTGKFLVSSSIKSFSRLIPVGMCVVVVMSRNSQKYVRIKSFS